MEKRKDGKLQSRRMEKDIELTKDVTAAWLQGGKAIGGALTPKRKK
jgi:hypothetical protein